MNLEDALAHKSDQVNFGAMVVAEGLDGRREALVVVYDVDSRPEVGSITAFRRAAADHPTVSVFHQSARLRYVPSHVRSPSRWLTRGPCELTGLCFRMSSRAFSLVVRILIVLEHSSPDGRTVM